MTRPGDITSQARKMRLKEAASKQQSRQFMEKRDDMEKTRRQERALRLQEALAEQERRRRYRDDTSPTTDGQEIIGVFYARSDSTGTI